MSVSKSASPVTLVTGVFDLLHDEHRCFLKKAKDLGGKLVVGVESDVRVREIKGEGRPINSQEKRVQQLAALGLADEIFVLPEDFSSPAHHEALIAKIQPRYLAVSSHTKHLDKKQAILAKFGGEVKVVHQHNPQVSTTQLLANGYNDKQST